VPIRQGKRIGCRLVKYGDVARQLSVWYLFRQALAHHVEIGGLLGIRDNTHLPSDSLGVTDTLSALPVLMRQLCSAIDCQLTAASESQRPGESDNKEQSTTS
jgi:hypothetical protein